MSNRNPKKPLGKMQLRFEVDLRTRQSECAINWTEETEGVDGINALISCVGVLIDLIMKDTGMTQQEVFNYLELKGPPRVWEEPIH
jgi:hypothetical protein